MPLASFATDLEKRIERGQPLGHIAIPELGLTAAVVQGTDPRSLRSGPGHYRGTALPGERGTVAIAGHRTTFSAPFRHLDELEPGDTVTLSVPYGRFEYRVTRSQIIFPRQVDVLAPGRRNELVLTTCHPVESAEERLVVFAREAAHQRLGGARRRTTPCVGNGCPIAG